MSVTTEKASPRALLEKSYGHPLSEAEFSAISRNLSEFFNVLHEWKYERKEEAND